MIIISVPVRIKLAIVGLAKMYVCMYVPMVQMLIHTLKQNEDQAYIQGTDVRVLGGE
jgi:hypothetical protein